MCFTTCWQERVTKSGKPFTSRSLKNTITSVRWDRNIITTSNLFECLCLHKFCVVHCVCLFVKPCMFLCVSVLVSCTGLKTSNTSTVTSVSLRTGKRGNSGQKGNTFHSFQHLLYSLHTYTHTLISSLLKCVCVCVSISFISVTACVWVFPLHLPLTHALRHPHPFTTIDKHTKTVFVTCHNENRFFVKKKMKQSLIHPHYVHGMWMLCKTCQISSSGL